MSIETEHRGYVIRYAENEDVWRCYDLEVDAPTLGAMRRKIDVIDRKRRAMAEPVQAIRLDRHKALRRVGVSMMSDAPRPGWTWEKSGKVWTLNEPTERKGREKVSVDQLSPITPEAEAAVAAFLDARKLEIEATARADATFSVIPRFTYEALAAMLPKEGG